MGSFHGSSPCARRESQSSQTRRNQPRAVLLKKIGDSQGTSHRRPPSPRPWSGQTLDQFCRMGRPTSFRAFRATQNAWLRAAFPHVRRFARSSMQLACTNSPWAQAKVAHKWPTSKSPTDLCSPAQENCKWPPSTTASVSPRTPSNHGIS